MEVAFVHTFQQVALSSGGILGSPGRSSEVPQQWLLEDTHCVQYTVSLATWSESFFPKGL